MSAALVVAGCGGARTEAPATAAPVASWRSIATPADRSRIARWRDAWLSATAKAQAAGAPLAAEGALFAFDQALADPVPPPGDYRCRVFKLGAAGRGLLDYVAYPWFACRLTREGALSRLAKLTGSQRHVGLIYPDRDGRAVFLGTLMLGDETSPIAYGRDRTRDLAGIVERVGQQRWRLAMPYPAFESTLDMMELVPQG